MQSPDVGVAALRLPLAFPFATAEIVGDLECLETLQPGALLPNLAQQNGQKVRSTIEEDRGYTKLAGRLEVVPWCSSLRRQIDRYDRTIDGSRDRSHHTLLVITTEPKCFFCASDRPDHGPPKGLASGETISAVLFFNFGDRYSFDRIPSVRTRYSLLNCDTFRILLTLWFSRGFQTVADGLSVHAIDPCF